jgi:hypothetical protein
MAQAPDPAISITPQVVAGPSTESDSPIGHSSLGTSEPTTSHAPCSTSDAGEKLDDVNIIENGHISRTKTRHRPASVGHETETETPAPSSFGSRFIGHLNPEGVFHADKDPIPSLLATSESNVGMWLRERNGNVRIPALQSTLFDHLDSEARTSLLPMVERLCSLMTSDADFHSLSAIYLDKIQPILPVLHRGIFETYDHDSGSILLQQGICLVASMNREAKYFLRLPDSPDLLTHRAFGKRIFNSMRATVDLGLVTDNIVLIQALALMSLYIEGPEGRAISSQLCARAIDSAHLIGLHVQARASIEDDEYAISLLCSVWAIDKLHAAFHGRPVLMHERDLRSDFDECIKGQQKPFRLFLQVVQLLHKVIDLYRPGSGAHTMQWEGIFPAFEELMQESSSFHIRTPLLGKCVLAICSRTSRCLLP